MCEAFSDFRSESSEGTFSAGRISENSNSKTPVCKLKKKLVRQFANWRFFPSFPMRFCKLTWAKSRIHQFTFTTGRTPLPLPAHSYVSCQLSTIRVRIPLPYLGPSSDALSKILRTYGYRVGFYSLCAIKDLSRLKDPLPPDDHSGIYCLTCSRCENIYIGKTGEALKERLYEYELVFWKLTGHKKKPLKLPHRRIFGYGPPLCRYRSRFWGYLQIDTHAA